MQDNKIFPSKTAKSQDFWGQTKYCIEKINLSNNDDTHA